MSERRIGESSLGPVNDMVVSTMACRGAPDAIQPGAVVAMADSMQKMIRLAPRAQSWEMQKAAGEAAAVLAGMYNGEKVE